MRKIVMLKWIVDVGEYKDEILRLFPGISVHVCTRAFRNKPLSEVEKVGNRVIACVRCRVKHVFGYMSRFMGVLFACSWVGSCGSGGCL